MGERRFQAEVLLWMGERRFFLWMGERRFQAQVLRCIGEKRFFSVNGRKAISGGGAF